MTEPASDSELLRQLRAQLHALQDDVASLQARLSRLEGQQAPASASRAATTALPPDLASTYGELVEALVVEPLEVVPPGSSIPAAPWPPLAAPTERVLSAARALPAVDWESLIGGKGLTWLGALVMVIALGFSVVWAWRTFETPAWLQVAIQHAGGTAILVGGVVLLRRQLKLAAEALLGLAIFTFYAVAYAAQHLYHLWDSTGAFGEFALITLLAVALALWTDSALVILIGALGGYLAPVLTSTGPGSHVALFSYLAFLNAGLLACAVWKHWSFLKPIAFVATALLFAAWIPEAEPADAWSTELLLGVHATIFLLSNTLPPWLWRRPSRWADLAIMPSNALGFLAGTWALFHDWPEQQMALVCWGLALLHLGLFGFTYVRLSNADRMPRLHLALAAVLFTLAAPLQIGDRSLWGVTWSVEALVFTLVGIYFLDVQLCVTGALLVMLAGARLLAFDLPQASVEIASLGVDRTALLLALSALLTGCAGSLYWLMPEARQWCWGHSPARVVGGGELAWANLLLLLSLACQFDGRWVLVLWVIDVALIWAVGFARDLAAARTYALLLALSAVLGRTWYEGVDLPGGYTLLANERFLSLLLVAALYFAFGWCYRRGGLKVPSATASPTGTAVGLIDPRQAMADFERHLDVPLGILANVVLLVALSLEVNSWFDRANASGYQPFPDMSMARLATYSVLWAIYAALLVIVGFVLRYRLFRVLGLVAFAPILLKVFLVDLGSLDLLPRVLAFAVLGMALLGVSILYQRFAPRLREGAS